MSGQTSSHWNDDSGAPRQDLQVSLARLRADLSTLGDGATLSDTLSTISGTVDRVLEEHSGMAEELLSVYEQLGAVFDVTRRLPQVQGEREVINLFVDCLSRSFAQRNVFLIRPTELADHDRAASSPLKEGWMRELGRRARDNGRVLVASPPVEPSPGDSVAELMIGPVFAGMSFVCSIVLTRTADVPAFRSSDMLLLESLTAFCGDLIGNHRLVHELRAQSVAMVRSLVSAVDQKDTYTSGHSLRVAYYSTMLGDALDLGEVDLQMLQWGALLHDVGKIGIRDEVLKKTGKLTPAEFDHIKEHPVRSHKVVQQVPQLAAALDGVLYHHERFDGTGYPEGLAGEDIPLQARIIQIGDVFDALTSQRSYRKAYGWREALNIMKKEAGRTIDPRLQKLFDGLIRRRLEGDTGDWESMTKEANKFRQVGEGPAKNFRRQ